MCICRLNSLYDFSTQAYLCVLQSGRDIYWTVFQPPLTHHHFQRIEKDCVEERRNEYYEKINECNQKINEYDQKINECNGKINKYDQKINKYN